MRIHGWIFKTFQTQFYQNLKWSKAITETFLSFLFDQRWIYNPTKINHREDLRITKEKDMAGTVLVFSPSIYGINKQRNHSIIEAATYAEAKFVPQTYSC